MQSWDRSAEIAAAEKAYVAAEMERLDLICRRDRMERENYLNELNAAWLRSADALEALTALRNAETAARLRRAVQEASAA